jgi:hypothetical protein
MRPSDLLNLSVEINVGLCVSWGDGVGNRYHCWIGTNEDDSDVWITSGLWNSGDKTDGGTIFKNPPLGLKPRDPGYFKTRYLDAGSKTWGDTRNYIIAWLKAGALAECRRKKVEHETEEQRVRREAAAEQERRQRLEAAAPAMFTALLLAQERLAEIAVYLDDDMPINAAGAIEELAVIISDAIKAVKKGR